MAVTNLGKVSITPKGDYDASAKYSKLDAISYEGSSFLVLKDELQGVTPIADDINYMSLAKGGSGGGYTLPVATENELGGIKATPKTAEQTEVVGIGDDNKLYVKPSSGGGGGSVTIDTTLSVAGAAADAKATGDAINNISPMQIQGAKILNYFDINYVRKNLLADHILSYKDGTINDSVGYSVTPKIYLQAGKTYTTSRTPFHCWLYGDDEYKLKITANASSVETKTFTVESSVKNPYILIAERTVNFAQSYYEKFMCVEGDTIPENYSPHEVLIPWLSIDDKKIDNNNFNPETINAIILKNKSISGKKIKEKDLSIELLKNSSTSENIFDYTAIVKNSLFNEDGYIESSAYFATEYMPVKSGEKYYLYYITGNKNDLTVFPAYAAYGIKADGSIQKLIFEQTEHGKTAVTIPDGIIYMVVDGKGEMADRYVISKKFTWFIPPFYNILKNTKSDIFGLLAGKTYVALGDSITRGCSNGETLPDGTVLNNGGQIPETYSKVAADLLGMNHVNFGVDGATVKTVLARINSNDFMAGLKYNPDIITCMIGTNDMAQVPLGTIEDVYDSSSVTYYSGLKEIARLLSEKYLSSKIVFLTPLRASENAKQFVKAMEEVADMYDIPCMAMHKVLRYMQKNSAGNFYINDYYNGLHPNQAGHFRMGTALAGFLNSI